MPSAASTPLRYSSLRNTPFQGLYLICANNLQSSRLPIQQLKHNMGYSTTNVNAVGTSSGEPGIRLSYKPAHLLVGRKTLPSSCTLRQDPCFSAVFCRKLRLLSSRCRSDPICSSIKGSAAYAQHLTHSSATCWRHLHTSGRQAPFCCLGHVSEQIRELVRITCGGPACTFQLQGKAWCEHEMAGRWSTWRYMPFTRLPLCLSFCSSLCFSAARSPSSGK